LFYEENNINRTCYTNSKKLSKLKNHVKKIHRRNSSNSITNHTTCNIVDYHICHRSNMFVDFESALQSGELIGKKGSISSADAINELKKAKEKLDL